MFPDIEHELTKDRDQLVELVIQQSQDLLRVNRELHREIVERKRVETELRESELKYRTLFENSSEALLLMSDIYLDCNEQACRVFGASREELIGHFPAEFSPSRQPDGTGSSEAAKKHLESALAGLPQSFYWRHHRRDGTPFDADVRLKRVTLSGRQLLLASVRDVTAQQLAEESLRESEERLSRIVNNASEIIYTLSPEGVFTFVSPAWTMKLGHETAEIVGRDFREFVSPEDALCCEDFLKKVLGSDQSHRGVEYRVRHKNGSWRWHSSAGSVIKDRQGRAVAFVGVAEDVTERRQAEEALRRSEEQYRLLAENITDMVWTCDLDFNCTYASPSSERVSGYSADEARRLRLEELLTPASAQAGERFVRESFERARQDPSILDRPVTWEGQLRHKNGSSVWIEVNVSVVRDEAGRPVGLTGVTRDISKRKAVEIELSRARQLAEAANQAKSEFLANMSHEIRTPMTAIIGYVDLLREQCREDCELHRAEVHDYCQIVLRNANHLLEILNDILDLSKIEAGKHVIEPVPCSPLKVLAEVIDLMKVRADAKGSGLALKQVNPVPDTILSDPLRLRQVLINLVGNAIKFTETGGVVLSVGLADAQGQNPLLRIEIADTGIGMSEEQMARLFQPFVQADGSSSRRFGGTGLGLVISKRLTEMLGGKIAVRSRPGQGSTFTVTLPTGPIDKLILGNEPTETTAGQHAQGPRSLEQALTGCRVLLAEDGPDNQRFLTIVLQKAGAEVRVVQNGQEAVDEALASREAGRAFQVVLMDMQMPVLDGYEATRKLRAVNWTSPIIALTAHAMMTDRQRCLEAGCDDYLSKPVDRQNLVEMVRRYGAVESERSAQTS
jgi:PAS domain S-box-containing protein